MDAEQGAGLHQSRDECAIVRAGRGVPARVVMRQDQPGGPSLLSNG